MNRIELLSLVTKRNIITNDETLALRRVLAPLVGVPELGRGVRKIATVQPTKAPQ